MNALTALAAAAAITGSSAAVDQIAAWRADPVLFVTDNFQPEEIEPWQREVLEAAGRERRIALKASKGPGKTCVLAWIAWWFMATHPHAKCVATSITADNLSDGLWAELAKWKARSPFLDGAFEWKAESVEAKGYGATWFISARAWPKGGSAEQQANTLAGIHADNVLFLIDEVGDIPDAVVAAAEAGLANVDEAAGRFGLLVLAGNPTRTSGPLWRACTSERGIWFVREISGDPDDPKRAKRVSREWALEQIRKYGRDSAFVLVNVFGQFPPGQADTLIAADVAAKAARVHLHPSEYNFAPKILGVDVARFGDDRTVLFPRQGLAAFTPRVLRSMDTMQVAGAVAVAIEKWKPDAVFIDVIGIGAGVVDRLRELGHTDTVFAANSSNKAPVEGYLNLRAYMWAQVRDWLSAGGSIPDLGELIGELSTPIYWIPSNGRLQLEPKDEIKARVGASPDLADALAFTFTAPVHVKTELERAKELARVRQQAQGGRSRNDYDPFAARSA